MEKNKKKIGCLAIVVIFILLWAVGSQTLKKEETEANKPVTSAEISVTAQDIAKTYKDNEVKAKKEYEEKKVAITGEIKKVGSSDIEDKDFVLLKGDSGLDIHCYFEKDSNSGLENLNVGDQVTIIGIPYDKFISVLVKNCSISK